jgi:hypothetical protein
MGRFYNKKRMSLLLGNDPVNILAATNIVEVFLSGAHRNRRLLGKIPSQQDIRRGVFHAVRVEPI